MEGRVESTKEQLIARCDSFFGFRPGPRRLPVEQSAVSNELRNIRFLLSRATGEEARRLRLKLESMVDVARKLGFRTEPQ